MPVGDNLQDHILVFLLACTVNQSIAITTEQTESTMPIIKYLLSGKGPLTSNGLEAAGFFRSDVQPADDPRPYLQSYLYVNIPGNHSHLHEFLEDMFNLNQEQAKYWWDQYHKSPPNVHGLVSVPCFQRPASRGTIRLNSGNPFHQPAIDPKYLSEDIDMQHFLSSIRQQQKLINTTAFKAYGAEIIRDKPHPRYAFRKILPKGTSNIFCYCLFSIYHGQSTLPMTISMILPFSSTLSKHIVTVQDCCLSLFNSSCWCFDHV